jgi:hypothetical protein
MRLYRFQGTDPQRQVSNWIRETEEYQNMIAASGRWFTDDIEEALWYRCDHGEGIILMIDVDDEIAENWRVSNIVSDPRGRSARDNPAAWSLRPEKEFFLPPEVATRAVPIDHYSDHKIREAAPLLQGGLQI